MSRCSVLLPPNRRLCSPATSEACPSSWRQLYKRPLPGCIAVFCYHNTCTIYVGFVLSILELPPNRYFWFQYTRVPGLNLPVHSWSGIAKSLVYPQGKLVTLLLCGVYSAAARAASAIAKRTTEACNQSETRQNRGADGLFDPYFGAFRLS